MPRVLAHSQVMLWEGRPLRDIREADIRRLVESGLREYLQLEYKSALYEDNDRGRREFLLDVCMFANASGGILLIGIPELRDGDGQPTGIPDSAAVLGLELANPETLLNAYDARVMEAIEERLPFEAHDVEVGQGRRVIAIRVPNSANKPHSVRHQGHIYFPHRRERIRSQMTVREIKELVMRTASRRQQAEEALKKSFLQVAPTGQPTLIIGMIPIFFEDFMVDVRAEGIRAAVRNFSRAGNNVQLVPEYTFEGIERRGENFDHVVRFQRNGLLNVSQQLPLISVTGDHRLHPGAADRLIRQVASAAKTVYDAGAISAPYLLGMTLRLQQQLVGVYANGPWEEETPPLHPGDYEFPYMQIDDLSETDRIIRPVCNQVHQTFGKEGSPNFDPDGRWIPRR